MKKFRTESRGQLTPTHRTCRSTRIVPNGTDNSNSNRNNNNHSNRCMPSLQHPTPGLQRLRLSRQALGNRVSRRRPSGGSSRRSMRLSPEMHPQLTSNPIPHLPHPHHPSITTSSLLPPSPLTQSSTTTPLPCLIPLIPPMPCLPSYPQPLFPLHSGTRATQRARWSR